VGPILTAQHFPIKISAKKWKKMEREPAKHHQSALALEISSALTKTNA
jgi:hypothetical protein